MENLEEVPQVEFLIELPAEISDEVEQLKQSLRQSGEFQAFSQERRSGDQLIAIIEVAIVIGQSIDVVTKGIEVVDAKKQAIDRAAKIVHEWLVALGVKGKDKKVRLTSPDGKEELKQIEGSDNK